MTNITTRGGFSLEQRLILESAEILLRPDQPDDFDYETLATLSGVPSTSIRAAFPFPELLTVGVVAVGWELEHQAMGRQIAGSGSWWVRALDTCRDLGQSWLLRPNNFRLLANNWQPDPELITGFADHPAVLAYVRGKSALLPTLLGVWPPVGAACAPEFLAMALRDRLNMIISLTATAAGKRAANNSQFLALNLLTDFLAGIGQILAENGGTNTALPTTEVRKLADV